MGVTNMATCAGELNSSDTCGQLVGRAVQAGRLRSPRRAQSRLIRGCVLSAEGAKPRGRQGRGSVLSPHWHQPGS